MLSIRCCHDAICSVCPVGNWSALEMQQLLQQGIAFHFHIISKEYSMSEPGHNIKFHVVRL